MDEDELVLRSANRRIELARIRRSLVCMVGMMIFWLVMLYLLFHHDDRMIIAMLIVAAFGLLYMLTSILTQFCWEHQAIRQSSSEGDEEAGLTAEGNMGVDRDDGAFSFSFEETPTRIKSNKNSIMTGQVPTNGTYTAVYSATFFNKSIRMEGKLRLEFMQTHDNGWTLVGESSFGKVSNAIKEGFINSRGEMYWISGESIYRGVLDFASSCMFDGEFVPNGNSEKGPSGRIIRLELAKAAYYSSSIEMLSFTSSATEEDSDDDGTTLFKG